MARICSKELKETREPESRNKDLSRLCTALTFSLHSSQVNNPCFVFLFSHSSYRVLQLELNRFSAQSRAFTNVMPVAHSLVIGLCFFFFFFFVFASGFKLGSGCHGYCCPIFQFDIVFVVVLTIRDLAYSYRLATYLVSQ